MSPCRSKATSVGRPKLPPRPPPEPGAVTTAASILPAFLEEPLEVVDRFVLAAEHHGDQPLRVELHHHVRAFVDHPEVVVLVEPDGVGEREAVGVLAPLLDVLAGLVELEELRRLRAARRTGVAAARVDEEMLLGIDRDADGFTDGVAGGHQRQRDGVVGNLRRVLLELGLRRERGLLLGAESASAATAAATHGCGWCLSRFVPAGTWPRCAYPATPNNSVSAIT